MKIKKLMAIFAPLSLISTPALAADAYVLQDNNGNQIHVLEVSQNEAREILKKNAQEREDTLPEVPSLEDVFQAKARVNADFEQSLRAIAVEKGMAPYHARSVASALKYSFGRDILSKNISMAYENYEFNPELSDKLMNGPTPTATTVFSSANGEKYRGCGIALADAGYSAEDWYETYTKKRLSDDAMVDQYDSFMQTENYWQLKASCFFLEEAYYADYYGTLQMLNESFGTAQYDAVKEYLNFKADMWMYMRIEKIVTTKDSRLFAQAKLAALRDFEAHGQKISEQDIWTYATAGQDMNGQKIDLAVKTWDKDIVERSQAAAERQRAFISRYQP